MTVRIRRVTIPAAFAVGFAVAWLIAPGPPAVAQPGTAAGRSLASDLVRAADAVPTRGDWGEWRRYFRGDTHGTKDLVVLAVTLKPGQEPHPPHRHAEEEVMVLADGAGTWHLDGKDVPAKKGDAVYAAPWAMHGVKNTGDAPLTYYMVKWNAKGVKPPDPPAGKADDDAAAVVGAWAAEDRHLAMGSLYQPAHATRQRTATVHFRREAGKLVGYAVNPDHAAITGQEAWKDGRTDFRSVTFAGGRLAFEFDVPGVRHGWERGKTSKGLVRVEARLTGDRLVGRWGLFDAAGEELFRGEWDAVRFAKK